MELFACRDGRVEDFHANAAEELFVHIVDEALRRKAHGHEAISGRQTKGKRERTLFSH